MAVIVTRAGKGSPLTNAEVDANFVNLNAAVVAAPGDLLAANNLSELTNKATARTNLQLGSLALLNAVGAAEITDLSVGTAELAGLSVTTAKIADANVTNAKMAANAVDTANLVNGAVTGPKMAAGAAVGNLGYTPVNKAGDTITGTLTVSGSLFGASASFSGSFATVQVNLSGGLGGAVLFTTGTITRFQMETGSYFNYDGPTKVLTWQIGSVPVLTVDQAGALTATKLTVVGGASLERSGAAGLLYFGRSPDAVWLYSGGFLDWYAGGAGSPLVRITDTGALTVAGEITFGAGADKVEPRGRYWSIYQPVASYTLVITDQGRLLIPTVAAANVITVPAEATVNFPIGTRIDFIQWGAGQTSFAPAAGVSLASAGNKRKITGQYSGASLSKITTDTWALVGDLAL